MNNYKRITIDHGKMGGVPCIRNLRMPVSTLIALLAEDYNEQSILIDHPELEKEDIKEALKFASEQLRFRELPLAI